MSDPLGDDDQQQPDGRMGGAGQPTEQQINDGIGRFHELNDEDNERPATLFEWGSDRPVRSMPDAEPSGPEDTLVQKWQAEGIPGARPRMSARAMVAKPMISQRRQPCEHCGGVGYMPGVSDYLRESIALVGDQGDEVVRAFYVVLLRNAPDLEKLFPPDLIDPKPIPPYQPEDREQSRELAARAGQPFDDESLDRVEQNRRRGYEQSVRGRQQRELLLNALVALSDMYDPDDGDKMQRLDTALGSFGRKHAAFARPDGTVKGATWEEYGAVKDALFQTLVRAAGEHWKAEYTEAWSQAYDYAAAVMLAEQFRSGFAAPRFPRA